MPRTFVFHSITKSSGGRWDIPPIDPTDERFRLLIADAKNFKDFSLKATGLSDAFIFDILLSSNLTPFVITEPEKGLLPIARNSERQWTSVPEHDIAAHGAATQAAFQSIFSAAGWTSAEYFAKLDSIRRKLSSQLIPEKGWLVFMGAGGDYVCAACAPASTYRIGKTIIDQTLYWAAVPTEDEALYLVGLLNSEALNLVIKDFQPRGQFRAASRPQIAVGSYATVQSRRCCPCRRSCKNSHPTDGMASHAVG